jgi:outer membrane protein, heavy metal efflux system
MILARLVGFFTIGSVLSGCASMSLDAGFRDVKASIEQQHQLDIAWNTGSELDKQAAAKLGALLNQTLAVDGAVQIALLNNRDLQAVYSDLGVAQADVVQAGLLNNPIFDAAVKFPVSGTGRPDLELGAAMNFLNLLYIPLRKRVAVARLEEAKTRVTAAVLDLAGRVRKAFYTYQADEQMLELRQSVVQALAASFEISQRIYQAGNISDLDYLSERAQFEAGKLALRAAEVSVRQSREELNALMGVWGPQTQWKSAGRLPELPHQPLDTTDLERVSLERSLDLFQARQRIVSSGEQLGLTRWTTLIPEFSAGPEAERSDGSWSVGPRIDFMLPLFDQGQAALGRTAAELRRSQQEYYSLGVRIRAQARAAGDRLAGASDRASYYRDILLPLHEHIVNETQLHYNAMQLGPFRLLRAREQQIQTAVGYVEALREYWLARADIGQILAGRLPNPNGAMRAAALAEPNRSNGTAGH